MATQEAPGGSNPPELGWAFRRYFDRLGPIYFWSAAGLFLGDRYQWLLKNRYNGRYRKSFGFLPESRAHPGGLRENRG